MLGRTDGGREFSLGASRREKRAEDSGKNTRKLKFRLVKKKPKKEWNLYLEEGKLSEKTRD